MLRAFDLVAGLTQRRADSSTPSGKRPVERVLVVELWNIGDVVLAMPFLAQLRVLFPGARITMLARPHAKAILAGTGLVDEFVETELGWTEKATRLNPFGYNWRELWRVRRELQARRFDLAFKARMHVREHLVLAFSGAKRTVGFAFGDGDRVLTDAIPIGDPNRHKVADWLELLKPFGGPVEREAPRLIVDEGERHWANAFLEARGVSANDRMVGIHPGASVPGKRWPLERFAEVAVAVAHRSDVRVLAFVEPEGYGESVARSARVIEAKVDLRQLIALIERCELLISNDSGPMHIAGALGVPTVSVFGSGIERWFSPLGEGHRVLTGITEVTPSQVLDAVNAALRSSRS